MDDIGQLTRKLRKKDLDFNHFLLVGGKFPNEYIIWLLHVMIEKRDSTFSQRQNFVKSQVFATKI